jgi:hypothetical protein
MLHPNATDTDKIALLRRSEIKSLKSFVKVLEGGVESEQLRSICRTAEADFGSLLALCSPELRVALGGPA